MIDNDNYPLDDYRLDFRNTKNKVQEQQIIERTESKRRKKAQKPSDLTHRGTFVLY